jgi:tRNA pseudouridine38-40 synthase
VQSDLESALAKLFRNDVDLACAGRTDAGVHALAQVVSTADAPDDTDVDRVLGAVNGMCGPSIVAVSCAGVGADFHARHSAKSRTYVYAILNAPLQDPWLHRTAWHVPVPLDVAAMNEAAGHLVGPHDFRSFGRLAEPGAPAERTLYELVCTRAGNLIRVRVRANAFLQQMVRSLVGTLVEVGGGKRSPDEVPEVMRARDRAAAGAVAPPHGLCLVAVEYDEGWSRPMWTGTPFDQDT